MKVCFKCNIEKPLSEFYKHKQMADGHLNKCKDCAKSDVRKNRSLNIDYYRNYDISRSKSEHRLSLNRRTGSVYRSNNPRKRAAQIALGNAVRDGRIKKSKCCSECGGAGHNGAIHGHHDDYSKPLAVRWLCPSCHKKWH